MSVVLSFVIKILLMILISCLAMLISIFSFLALLALQNFMEKQKNDRKAKNNDTIKIPEPFQFNIKREPIRLTFDNIEYFEVRDGEVVRDKFETDLVELEKVPIIGSCGSYQYKKIPIK